MSNRIYLMRDWYFCEKFRDEFISHEMGKRGTDEFEMVSLPHTIKEVPFHYFDEAMYQLEAAYQKVIHADKEWKGSKLFLMFEAVGHYAEVYLNGKRIGSHEGGYTAFQLDLTEALKYDDDNLLTVKVDARESLNQPPLGFVVDYLTYGGIYRDVYLEIKHPASIRDIFLKPQVKTDLANFTLDDIKNRPVEGRLVSEIEYSSFAESLMQNGSLQVKQQVLFEDKTLAEYFGKAVKEVTIDVPSVPLWDIESPKRAKVITQLFLDEHCVDEREELIGFRKVIFKTDGFYLNDRKVKIRGLNRHQSYAYVGYAMPESMQRKDAQILKEELSLNAVRTSHYPQSHYFIDECDRLGLLVFTEMPGWQHIGNEEWQEKAIRNVEEMVVQYRNHPSIILWGVRINESQDNDEFYKRTNAAAHSLDDTRQTGGVRALKKSHLLEDVYTYNDFVHSGKNIGCEPKRKVTSDTSKPYLISEYNGHMYPTKSFDDEEHRMEHMLRHANVIDAAAGENEIAGSFGWCMFDYNTHKDFGSGDRICYHGVMDMFRNKKMAAHIYAAQEEKTPILELSSTMDIGEHPACNRDDTYIIFNTDKVRVYKNNRFIKEYSSKDSAYKNIKHGPVLIDDYIGNAIKDAGVYKPRQAEMIKYLLNSVAMHGMKITPKMAWYAFQLVVIYHMNPAEMVPLYNRYVGDWGGESAEYKFEAIQNEQIVKTIFKTTMKKPSLQVDVSHTTLIEKITYDVAEIRIQAVDENRNLLPYFQEPLCIETNGPIEVIGPKIITIRGGMTGVYVKSIGKPGSAAVTLKCERCEEVVIHFEVKSNS